MPICAGFFLSANAHAAPLGLAQVGGPAPLPGFPGPLPQTGVSELAWLVLAAFLATFLVARMLVFLIMAGKAPPGLFLHVKGTHIHHLNYGIFLLSAVGAYLLFGEPGGTALMVTGALYGIGLGLTFDEFGMWLHLGGPYWQRASFDAVVVVAAVLGLIAVGSSLPRWRPHHWITGLALAAGVALFAVMLYWSFGYADRRLGPRLKELEEQGPP